MTTAKIRTTSRTAVKLALWTLLLTGLTAAQLLATAGNAAAAETTPPAGQASGVFVSERPVVNPLQAQTLPALIGRVIRIFTGVVGSIALLMFIYGGFLLLTSRGEAEKVDQGKKIFIYSALGLIIIFSAYAILSTVFKTIGAA